jgi:hypothetical protein
MSPPCRAKGDPADAQPLHNSWNNERFFTRTSGILHFGNEIVERRGAVRGNVLQGNNIALEGPRGDEEPCLAHLISLAHNIYASNRAGRVRGHRFFVISLTQTTPAPEWISASKKRCASDGIQVRYRLVLGARAWHTSPALLQQRFGPSESG